MSQPASLRRALMEVFEVESLRKRFRSMCRTVARFSAECPVPHPVFVFTGGQVQHPVDAVLDAPMAPGCLEQSLWV